MRDKKQDQLGWDTEISVSLRKFKPFVACQLQELVQQTSLGVSPPGYNNPTNLFYSSYQFAQKVELKAPQDTSLLKKNEEGRRIKYVICYYGILKISYK